MDALKHALRRWTSYAFFVAGSSDRKLAVPIGYWLFVVLPWLETFRDFNARLPVPMNPVWN
jgi:hypothetical protein